MHRLWPVVGMLAASALVVGQFQVNRQVNRGGGPPSVRYASSPYAQRIDQSAASMLPSQTRYAVMRSGALPSEIRMNVHQAGPMAPTGALTYLPPTPATYTPPGTVTQGNLLNAQAARPSTPMPSYSMPSAGSVRYAPGPIGGSSLTPSSSLGLAPKPGLPIGQQPYGQTMTGSIRYGSQ